MAHLKLSQKSFKTFLRKLTIIASVIPRNNLFFLIKKAKKNQQKKTKKREKKVGQFFFFIFRKCPKKGAKGDAVYIFNALQVFLKRMKQKRQLEKKN